MHSKTAKIQFYSADRLLLKEAFALLDDRVNADAGSAVEVDPGQSIQATLQSISLRLPRAAVALVNGHTNDLGYILQPGDCVKIIFQISGG